MSIQQLKLLRDKAWIPTPQGEQFSLHFDDTLYLKLVAQHILDQVAQGTNHAPLHQVLQQLRVEYR